MKKILFLIAFFIAIVSFIHTYAFDTKVGEEVYITEEVNDDLYVAGGSVDINKPVNGDLFIAGGEINIDSDISQDLLVTGGNIDISGSVGDDVRIAGGNIKINSNIDGDLLIGAGTVKINKGVIIKGDLVVGAGRVVVDGVIDGNAKITAGQLVLNGVINGNADIILDEFLNVSNTGLIDGNLKYKSKEKIQELENSVNSEVVFEKSVVKEKVEKSFIGIISTIIFVKILGLFVFSVLFYFSFKKYFSSISNNLKNYTGKSFLYGFVTIFGVPIIIFLLFISVIGISFAFFFLFTYIFMFVFLSLINVVIFSSFFIDKYHVKNIYKKLFIIFGLTLFFGLINGIDILVGFFTIGAIVIKKIEIIQGLRKKS